MKKITPSKFAPSCALLLSLALAAPLSADSLSLKTGEDKVVTEWWDWSDASKWSPSVSEVAGNDLSVDINNGGQTLNSTINPGFRAGDVSIKVENPTNHVYFDVEGDAVFGSLSVSQNSKDYYGTYIRVLTGSTLTVNGDVNVSPSSAYTANAIFLGHNHSDYGGSFHIGGNLNLNANIGDAWYDLIFNTNNAFIVDGTVNTTEVQNGRQFGVIWKIGGETTRIGGLQGSNLYRYNKLSISESKGDRTLTFTNKAGTAASWSGAIDNGGNRFNIVMDESAAGSQDLDIVSGTVNDIALKGGIFYISSVSATTGTLSIDGGFYNTKGDGAKFAAIDLSSGGFIFESGALENGYEVSAGEISKSGTEKITVDFNGLYTPDYYGYEFVLISADAVDETIDLENANGDFAAANLYDGYAIFKWAENEGKYALSVTFSEVPEPAAAAMLLGAGALFFALRRKRA